MSLIPFAGAVQKFNRQRDTQYQIERSLRFNSADSAYLSKTWGSAPTAATKGTWSYWIKRTKLATEVYIIGSRDGGNSTTTFIRIESGDTLRFYNHNGTSVTWNMITSQVFRDVGAWMHIVVALDTTQATDTNRIKIYVNGTQVTAFGTASYPAQNATMTRWAANGVPNYIGNEGTTPSNYGDYYLAETHYIDGQQLDPTSFGEFNSTTGVWQPKAYTGSYGTNGFYLDFSDNTSTTTLGYDAAGSNDWTLNNFSVTAGAGNDSLVDTPTPYGDDTGAGGEVRGNYATMNPLQYSSTYAVLSNGNLNVAGASGVDAGGAFATAKVNSGKWYWEALILGTASTYPFLGFAVNTTGAEFQGGARIGTAGTPAIVSPESFITLNGSPSGTSFTTNDVLQFALDMDNGKMWIGKNGTWMNSGVPASGTGNMFSISDTSQYVSPYIFSYNTSSVAFNFGQRAFSYTAPSGFKALCTQNLPEPTIVDGGDYFNTVLYTGNGVNNGDQQAITGVGFAPDMVWLKSRSAATAHYVSDQVRGVNKTINTNTTGAEQTQTIFPAFGSDGFTVERQSTNAGVNENGATYVAWNWKAGNSNVTNTDGTITSTVRANPTAGFSIVTYTGNGSAGATVGHGLGVAPSMVFAKNRSQTDGWPVWHTSLSSNTHYLVLQATNAQADDSSYFNGTFSSTVFSVGGSTNTNQNGDNYVAYCFAAIPGYSAFGSYTGNGSADGPFVYTGFRPAWVMVKSSTSVRSWLISDGVRNPYNVTNLYLLPNSSNAEATNNLFDFTSNGFKVRDSLVGINESSETFIYAAFSEAAFKYSLAR